jgi:hypothetical protein
MKIASQVQNSHDLATWGEAILGVLPVLATSLTFSLLGPNDPFSDLFVGFSYLFMLILPVIGVLVLVRRDHWQWFWTYIGLILYDIFITLAAIFPYFVGISWLVWLLRIASMLLVVFVIYFLVKLQERLTVRPQVNIDMSYILLAAIMIVPYFIAGSLEGTPAAFRLPYALLAGGILSLGIVVFLRTRWHWLRVVSLAVAVYLAMYMVNTVLSA